MKVKKKIQSAPGLPAESAFVSVHKFLDECRRYEEATSLTTYGAFLAGEHRRLFGTEPPSAMLCLIKAKIAYRLQYVGCKSAGRSMSASFLKNYEAAQNLKLEDFETNSKFMMELSIKSEQKRAGQQEEPTMVTVKKKVAAQEVKKAAKENPKKGSVTRSWIQLMEAQPKAKLSDARIAGEMQKLHPDKKKYTEKDVASVRSLFNRGKLVGQAKKPATPLTEIVGAKK